jgi:citrate synthase
MWMATASGWLSSEEAAARLHVKPETLYAYVSRGMLRREREPGGRRSRYLRADVERLVARGRAGGDGRGGGGAGRAGGLEIIVESELTRLDPNGSLSYRGWDVEEAAASATFEEVAAWLWTARRTPTPFVAPPELVAVVEGLHPALASLPLLDAVRAAVAALRWRDPLRDDRRPEAVAATGRGIVATLLELLPSVSTGGASRRRVGRPPSVAERLWVRISPKPPTAARVRILDAALILLADHELAASALAARVTASTWADPYLVVLAGLAALGGPLHGGSSSDARLVIREVAEGRATAAQAIGSRLRDGERIAGFGHRVYLDRDPRADVLFALLDDVAGKDAGDVAARAAAHDLVATMRDRELPFVNVDFALAALAEAYSMIPGASEVIFAFARIVGWLAHGAEEYQHRLRFRPRAVYIGPALTTPPAP